MIFIINRRWGWERQGSAGFCGGSDRCLQGARAWGRKGGLIEDEDGNGYEDEHAHGDEHEGARGLLTPADNAATSLCSIAYSNS